MNRLLVPLSGLCPPPEERKAARRQPLAPRAAYVAARRELARERDAPRFELAAELCSRPARVAIPLEAGFASRPPCDITASTDVVTATNELMDSIGHDDLIGTYASDPKKPYLAHQLLDKKSLALDSAYLRFALDGEILQAVSTYLGVVPVLHHMDAWYSVAQDAKLVGSQLWHLDHDDTSLVKVWVHCSDIGPENGPLTALPADRSAELADQLEYDMGKGYRVPDDPLREHEDALITLEGPTGTVDLIDTCRCFHMGSRIKPGALARRIFYCAYVTPYSFNFGDHRQEAPFRELVGEATTELEQLVLGGA